MDKEKIIKIIKNTLRIVAVFIILATVLSFLNMCEGCSTLIGCDSILGDEKNPLIRFDWEPPSWWPDFGFGLFGFSGDRNYVIEDGNPPEAPGDSNNNPENPDEGTDAPGSEPENPGSDPEDPGADPDDPSSDPLIHKHIFSDEWSFDDSYHWHSATCEHANLFSDFSSHEDLNKDELCDVCGVTYLPPEDNVDGDGDDDGDSGSEGSGSEGGGSEGGGSEGGGSEGGGSEGGGSEGGGSEGGGSEGGGSEGGGSEGGGSEDGGSEGDDDNIDHECLFSDAWAYDSSGHWHESVCEDHPTVKADYDTHSDYNKDSICDICDAPYTPTPDVEDGEGGGSEGGGSEGSGSEGSGSEGSGSEGSGSEGSGSEGSGSEGSGSEGSGSEGSGSEGSGSEGSGSEDGGSVGGGSEGGGSEGGFGEDTPPFDHECTHDDVWSSDKEAHWHQSTCEDHDTVKLDWNFHCDVNFDTICDYCGAFYCTHTDEYFEDIGGVCSRCGCANMGEPDVDDSSISEEVYEDIETGKTVESVNVDMEYLYQSREEIDVSGYVTVGLDSSMQDGEKQPVHIYVPEGFFLLKLKVTFSEPVNSSCRLWMLLEGDYVSFAPTKSENDGCTFYFELEFEEANYSRDYFIQCVNEEDEPIYLDVEIVGLTISIVPVNSRDFE